MKRDRFGNVFLLFLLVAISSCGTKEAGTIKENPKGINYYEGIKFEMPEIKEPVFADNTVYLTDFEAKGDGLFLNSDAFKAAIDSLSSVGGGKLIIPRGVWLTGPIKLKSNINLHAEEGALILFSDNKDLYPIIETSFEGLNTFRCLSPIYGKNLENIAFTGRGVYDGTGDSWRAVKKSKLTASQWKKKVTSGGFIDESGKNWYPSKSFMEASKSSKMNVPTHLKTKEEHKPIRDFLRPVMVSLVSCKNILIEGATFQNSPAWCLHPLMCENMILRNITVKNPWYSQNGDGIDIESCKNTILYECSFDVGDDAICIKSGKDKDGRDRGVPTENLIVKNCIVYHGHGGVTVGSEMSGGVKNMHVTNCTFMGTDVGLRFKSTRGRGGVVEGIYISDIQMINIPTYAISFNLYYGGKSVTELMEQGGIGNESEREIPEVTEETPRFKDVFIKNVVCKGARQAIMLQGLPEMNLENVHLTNIKIKAQNGLTCIDATKIYLKNVDLQVDNEPAMFFLNAKNIEANSIVYPETISKVVDIHGKSSENYSFNKNDYSNPDSAITIAPNLPKDLVKLK